MERGKDESWRSRGLRGDGDGDGDGLRIGIGIGLGFGRPERQEGDVAKPKGVGRGLFEKANAAIVASQAALRLLQHPCCA